MSTPAKSNDPTTAGYTGAGPDRHGELARALADAVLAHPAVVRLDGGPFGVVASYLPGGRVVGVSLGAEAASAEVAVVLWLGHPFPSVVEELRSRAQSVLGDVPVDITIADVVTDEPEDAEGPPGVGPRAAGSTGRRVQ
jgi:hypothetical protein